MRKKRKSCIDKKTVMFHVISVALLLGSLAIGIFVQRIGYIRCVEAFRDFGTSVGIWFCSIFGIDNGIPATVGNASSVGFNEVINFDFESFKNGFSVYGNALISAENFAGYVVFLLTLLVKVMPIALVVGILLLVLAISIQTLYFTENNDYHDSKQLTKFKKITSVIYLPIKRFISEYAYFVQCKVYYAYIFLMIWAINVNIVAIGVEAVAFLLYFSVSLNPTAAIFQGYKLFLDTAFLLKSLPAMVWIVVVYLFWNYRRKERGYERLTRMDDENDDFSKNIAVLFTGRPGSGKTTMLTSVALSISKKQRFTAFRQILEIDMRFPYFPWIKLEKSIEKLMEKGKIYNLATCKKYIRSRERRFMENPKAENIFGYDFERYNMDYDDGLKIRYIFDELENYAKLYFMYVVNTSFLQSNFSVREDYVVQSVGNFPMYDYDFFRKNARTSEVYSRHSHILVMDCLRLGKKVSASGKFANYAEFGVFLFSEAAKDRGNQYDHQKIRSENKTPTLTINNVRKIIQKYGSKTEIMKELAKLDAAAEETANPLNDYFNLMIKMFRHMTTIDGVCYSVILLDEQRPTSLNADLLDLCVCVKIVDKSNSRSALPGFWLDSAIHNVVYGAFRRYYNRMRFTRGDTTLLTHLLKTIAFKENHRFEKLKNTFSYSILKYVIDDGSERNGTEYEYRLSHKKVYADRFETACFSDFFEKRALKSKVGLADVPCYENTRATVNELNQCGSYFVSLLTKDIFEYFKEDLKEDMQKLNIITEKE